jgi:hypothetical protein
MTLNQQYKQSGSELSFKEWLFNQQKEGSLDFNTEEFMNEDKDGKIGLQLFGIPVLYIGIGVVVIIGGFWAYSKYKK